MDDLKILIKKVLNDICEDYYSFKEEHKGALLFRSEHGLQAQIYHRLMSNEEFIKKYHIYVEFPDRLNGHSATDLVIFKSTNGIIEYRKRKNVIKSASISKPIAMLELKHNLKRSRGYLETKKDYRHDMTLIGEIRKEIIEFSKHKKVPLRIVIVFDSQHELKKEELETLSSEDLDVLYAYFDLFNKKKHSNFLKQKV